MADRNVALIVTVGLLAATLSLALPNLRVEIHDPEGESIATETFVSPRPPDRGTEDGASMR